MGPGEPSTTWSTDSTPSRASSAITHSPSASIPRRPARPAIWVSSLWESAREPRSARFGRPRRPLPRLVARVVPLVPLRGGQERPSLGEDVLHRALAAGAAEDEVDRGEPPPRLAPLDAHRPGGD